MSEEFNFVCWHSEQITLQYFPVKKFVDLENYYQVTGTVPLTYLTTKSKEQVKSHVAKKERQQE